MAIDRARPGSTVGYLCDFIGFEIGGGSSGPVTIRICDAGVFPQGYTDDDGGYYQPRMRGLVIDQNLGGFSLGRSGFIRETATFSIDIGGYSDTEFWTTFYNGGATRLEVMQCKIRLRDVDDGSEEYIFNGFTQATNLEFAPHSEVKIKALGGPGALYTPLDMEAFVSDDFEEGAAIGEFTFRYEDDTGPGLIKPWIFGNNIVTWGVVFQTGTGTSANLANQYSRAVCFNYRLSQNEWTTGGPWWASNYNNTVAPPDRGVVAVHVPTTGTADVTYTQGGRNLPYHDLRFNPGSGTIPWLGAPDREREHSAWAHGNYDDRDLTEVLDYLLFQTGGYLEIGSGFRDSTAWTAWTGEFAYTASANYETNVFLPGPDKDRRQQIPTLISVLEEIMWYYGSDCWWEYNAAGNAIYYFASRDATAARAAVIEDWQIEKNSLKLLVDPLDEYANRTFVNAAERWTAPQAPNFGTDSDGNLPKKFRHARMVQDTGETAEFPVKTKEMACRFVSSGTKSYFRTVALDRADELSRSQLWYEWSAPWTEDYTLHDVISFSIGSFPTANAQIRRKKTYYDRNRVRYWACQNSGIYNAS